MRRINYIFHSNIIKSEYPCIEMNIIIPSVDSEQIIPKIKIYESNGIDYWYPSIGFGKFTDANRK